MELLIGLAVLGMGVMMFVAVMNTSHRIKVGLDLLRDSNRLLREVLGQAGDKK